MSIWASRRISDVFWLDLTHFTRCCLRKTSRGPIVPLLAALTAQAGVTDGLDQESGVPSLKDL